MIDSDNYSELPKKQLQLITTATELFYKHGIRRVTIEEVCKNANVSKMTFYKYFSNKWDIAKTILDMVFEVGVQLYHDIIDEDIPFVQKVEEILKLTMARVHGAGVGSALIEDVAAEDSPLHDHFVEQQKVSRQLAIDFFTNAQKKGFIHSDIEMPVLLFMLNRLSDLLNHPEFVSIKPRIEDRIYELSSLFFHGFSRIADTNGPLNGQNNVKNSHP